MWSFLIYWFLTKVNPAHSQGWGYLAFSSPSAPQPCILFLFPSRGVSTPSFFPWFLAISGRNSTALSYFGWNLLKAALEATFFPSLHRQGVKTKPATVSIFLVRLKNIPAALNKLSNQQAWHWTPHLPLISVFYFNTSGWWIWRGRCGW